MVHYCRQTGSLLEADGTSSLWDDEKHSPYLGLLGNIPATYHCTPEPVKYSHRVRFARRASTDFDDCFNTPTLAHVLLPFSAPPSCVL